MINKLKTVENKYKELDYNRDKSIYFKFYGDDKIVYTINSLSEDLGLMSYNRRSIVSKLKNSIKEPEYLYV